MILTTSVFDFLKGLISTLGVSTPARRVKTREILVCELKVSLSCKMAMMQLQLYLLSATLFASLTACNCNGQLYCPPQGPPGQPGIPGTPGTPGSPGIPGTLACCGFSRRWKQCAWQYDITQDNRDNGLVHECDFVKSRNVSYLRVVYMGNIRMTGCTECCKRWYFTFNNTECTDPAPIDGVLYQSLDVNIHRATNIEGYCGGVAAGKVKVAFSIGNCGNGVSSGSADGYTSWNQASRIIIEEVEPPVA